MLLHKHLAYEIIVVDNDNSGRMVTAHLKFKTKKILITNIYTPNAPTTAFFQEATRWILKKTQCPYLIGGDFNVVLRKEEDRSTHDLFSSHS